MPCSPSPPDPTVILSPEGPDRRSLGTVSGARLVVGLVLVVEIGRPVVQGMVHVFDAERVEIKYFSKECGVVARFEN